ncbi:MAG TPA: DUF3592 domain-containing protein [Candidatus Limnocylindrales bacterium]|nr:DUF3592 domain-containing protein [Candidatus Limnocylindrales bacterium]
MNKHRTSIRNRIADVPFGWWALIIGVVAVAISALPLVDSLRFMAAAGHTTGVIVKVVPDADSYQPIVEYTSADGQQRRFTSSQTAGERSYYQVGHTVGVLYAPDNPADARLDTWQSRWANDSIIPALGVFIFVLGLLGIRQSRRNQGPYNNQRHFTATPAQTYTALTTAVRARFRVNGSDQAAMRIRFHTRANIFTWGETFTAQVTATPSGATVQVTGVGNVSTVLWQTWRLNTLTQRLLADITAVLSANTSPAQPHPHPTGQPS